MICTARSSGIQLCIMRRITPSYKFNEQTANLLSVSSAPIRWIHKQLHESQIWWHMCQIYVSFSEKLVCSLLFSFHHFCLLFPPCTSLCLCHLPFLCVAPFLISFFLSFSLSSVLPVCLLWGCHATYSFKQYLYAHTPVGGSIFNRKIHGRTWK